MKDGTQLPRVGQTLLLIFTMTLLITGGAAKALADSKSAPAAGHAGNPQMDEQMKQMMALATPGEHHQALNKMAGDWNTTMTSYMDPAAGPTVSTGTAHCEWILGGRYMQSKHTATFGGMPFEGLGLDGYDNAKKEYFTLWLDNMGTGFMMLTGQASADGKSISFAGMCNDPSQGKDVPIREEVRWTSETSYVFEMYMTMTDAQGKSAEMKVMELAAVKK
jgi:hypothetical protein